MSAIPKSGFSRRDGQMRSYSGGRARRSMSSNWRSIGPSEGSHALRRSRRVSSSYRNSSGSWPGLIRAEFILACSALSASLKQQSKFSRRAADARCPCPEPSSSVLPTKRRTTEHAAPFVVTNGTCCTSPRWPCFRPRAWNCRCLSPQMIPSLRVGFRKRPCCRC